MTAACQLRLFIEVGKGPENAVMLGRREARERFDTLKCQMVMTSLDVSLTRRAALSKMGGFLGLAALPWDWHGAGRGDPFPHPEPRVGITAEKVLPEEKLPDKKRVREAFAAVRERPELFDGIYCPCECSKNHRSLLTCFESAQPTGCYGCIEAAELVSEKAREGKTLAEIREIVDKKWG
jgi:hypothetical protein